MSEIWTILINILASSTASIGAILIFVSRKWFIERLKGSISHEYNCELELYKDGLRRKTESELESHKNELRRQTETGLEQLKSAMSLEVEKAKLKLTFYSEKQFRIYNDLWLNLCELKIAMDDLWAVVNQDTLLTFQQQLLKTDDLLEKGALLVEQRHYQELKAILNDFGNYRLGKQSLYELRQEQDEVRSFNTEDIRRLTEENRQCRARLASYLPQMRECLRWQISGQSVSR